ncbi:MAG: 30S ribosomal protein S13 [Planctomycetota bacterium]|nr:30S ribosomal protein S13 [Planctomycetota bacterium]
MPRIVGIDIPNDKPVFVALRYIYGIGPATAMDICRKAELDPQVKAGKLSEQELSKIASVLEGDCVIEGQLRRQIQQNIARLRDIRCYRGLRHRRGLPVRGQRTKTNARTRKGPKKTVAGKKSVKEMR